MTNNPVGVVMRDSSISSTLIKDVIKPEFYDNLGEFVGMEFT